MHKKRVPYEKAQRDHSPSNRFSVVWDRDWIYRTVRVVDLVKEAKTKNRQKEKILAFVTEIFRRLEGSGLITLLEKAAREKKLGGRMELVK